MLKKITNYFKDSYLEMKKVVWPNKKETTNYTLLVVGVGLGMAVFLGALDYLFSWIIALLIK